MDITYVIATREHLITQLSEYTTSFDEERKFISRILELLNHHRAFHRDHLPGHLTASAWIVNPENTHTLLVHHAKLNRWLQPGGHADGEENLLKVAQKEMHEETGLDQLPLLVNTIFDLDIHPIPARNNFPEHLHYDVRFAFVASIQQELKISDESSDLRWVALNDVPALTRQNHSILRMIQKTITRQSALSQRQSPPSRI